MPIKLLIADDHQVVRSGLNSIFECEDHMEVIGEAINGEELIEKALELKPDVIISDLKMPVMTGIEAAQVIKEKDPDIRIILLTAFDEQDDVHQAIESGVDGYLIKDTLPDELVKAIELVYRGYSCIFPAQARNRAVDKKLNVYQDSEEEITEREMEVFHLIAQNYSNQEIARKLFISEATVKSHVSKILRKTGQPNRAQAVVYGLSTGLFNSNNIRRSRIG